MRIILARHGQTVANAEKRFQGWADFPLNTTGQKQAKRLASLLAKYQVERIYTSDLQRTIDTASPAAKLLKLTPISLPIFREYCWGEFDGLTWTDIKERYPALFSHLQKDLRAVPIPGQEDVIAFRERIRDGIDILLKSEVDTVAVISHSRFLNALIVEFLGLDFAGPWPFSFIFGAITELEISNDRRRLIKFNAES